MTARLSAFKEPAKHWCGVNCPKKKGLFEPDLKPRVSVNTGSIHMKQKLTQRPMCLLLEIYELSCNVWSKYGLLFQNSLEKLGYLG